MIDLARRAVACERWQWLPGMLARHPNWRAFRVANVGLTGMRGACRYASPMGGVEWAVVALPVPTSSDVLPDLTDPATLGCLHALVREAWGDPRATLYPMEADGSGGWLGWGLVLSDGRGVGPFAEAEAEALVAALEAAP